MIKQLNNIYPVYILNHIIFTPIHKKNYGTGTRGRHDFHIRSSRGNKINRPHAGHPDRTPFRLRVVCQCTWKLFKRFIVQTRRSKSASTLKKIHVHDGVNLPINLTPTQILQKGGIPTIPRFHHIPMPRQENIPQLIQAPQVWKHPHGNDEIEGRHHNDRQPLRITVWHHLLTSRNVQEVLRSGRGRANPWGDFRKHIEVHGGKRK